MLSLTVVGEIQLLLDEGELSQRKIAAKLNVSRGTVNAIASGKRGLFGRELDPLDLDDELDDLTPERCPGCGGLVYMPCLLCRAREYHAQQQMNAACNRRPHPNKRVA